MTNFSEKNLSREVQNHNLICLCRDQMKIKSIIKKWIFVFSRHDKIAKKDKITSEFALSRDCKKSPIASSAGRKGGEVRVQLSFGIIHYHGGDWGGEG